MNNGKNPLLMTLATAGCAASRPATSAAFSPWARMRACSVRRPRNVR